MTGLLFQSGRHVVVTAHPDDETISFGGALCALADVQVLQLTDGVHADAADRNAQIVLRRQERAAAYQAAGWAFSVADGDAPARAAHEHLLDLLIVVCDAISGADVVWTHPYEGGHLDHDSAAWLVQTACAMAATAPRRMEFASYHSRGDKRDVFGEFWPDPMALEVAHTLAPEVLARKQVAIAAYTSQASILRKFPTMAVEHYRSAPVYDFTQPPSPPAVRWDRKGYQPSTTAWRATVAEAQRALERVS